MHGKMICNFCLHFNSISVILERWEGDIERLCEVEHSLQLKRLLPTRICGFKRSPPKDLDRSVTHVTKSNSPVLNIKNLDNGTY